MVSPQQAQLGIHLFIVTFYIDFVLSCRGRVLPSRKQFSAHCYTQNTWYISPRPFREVWWVYQLTVKSHCGKQDSLFYCLAKSLSYLAYLRLYSDYKHFMVRHSVKMCSVLRWERFEIDFTAWKRTNALHLLKGALKWSSRNQNLFDVLRS